MARHTNTVIEAKDLVKTYGTGDTKVDALKGVSLNIKEGEFVAIMGPSGSGKSTLMHLLGCLDQSTSGTYKLDGSTIKDLNDNDLARIRNEKIGFIFQQFNLLPRTSSLENVMLPFTYTGHANKNARKQAEETLRSVGLGKHFYKRPSELSGGEQQRVAISRAMINNPSIILADEPTGALDTKTGIEVLNIFQKLNKEGKTIILITHERDIAAFAKRRIHLRDGLVESDSAKKKKEIIEST
ncbi:MAG: ABC transporter ATP-binding protein [Actinobacteria bacterium]|nr:MAG: ABC transporter ATP-binding protein [Actinomycetota bacterium]